MKNEISLARILLAPACPGSPALWAGSFIFLTGNKIRAVVVNYGPDSVLLSMDYFTIFPEVFTFLARHGYTRTSDGQSQHP
jgi:hypothetical protein